MNLLDANIRDTKTKGDLSALRNNGSVPAIIYGGEASPPYIMAGTLPLFLRALKSPLVFVSLMFASSKFIKSWVFSPSSLITQGNYLNKSETDVELDILLIASPIKAEIGRTSMFLIPLVLLLLSIVSVITRFLITEPLIFLTASPLNTP